MFEQKECFICCDKSGKSEQEKLLDKFAGNNAIIMNYPIIKLSSAFGCKCNEHAHNTCIAKLNKCPTCRKCTQPHVYHIPTPAEKYMIFAILGIILTCLTFFVIMSANCDKSIKQKADFCSNIDSSVCVIIYFCFMLCVYSIKWIESRWLFDIYRMKPLKIR